MDGIPPLAQLDVGADPLEGRHWGHVHFEIDQPEALSRLERLDRDIAETRYELDLERQSLDGIAPEPPPIRGFSREPDELEWDLDLGLGL